jgi:hypothetical protein
MDVLMLGRECPELPCWPAPQKVSHVL